MMTNTSFGMRKLELLPPELGELVQSTDTMYSVSTFEGHTLVMVCETSKEIRLTQLFLRSANHWQQVTQHDLSSAFTHISDLKDYLETQYLYVIAYDDSVRISYKKPVRSEKPSSEANKETEKLQHPVPTSKDSLLSKSAKISLWLHKEKAFLHTAEGIKRYHRFLGLDENLRASSRKPLEILFGDVPPGDPPIEEIEHQFRRLNLVLHPDKQIERIPGEVDSLRADLYREVQRARDQLREEAIQRELSSKYVVLDKLAGDNKWFQVDSLIYKIGREKFVVHKSLSIFGIVSSVRMGDIDFAIRCIPSEPAEFEEIKNCLIKYRDRISRYQRLTEKGNLSAQDSKEVGLELLSSIEVMKTLKATYERIIKGQPGPSSTIFDSIIPYHPYGILKTIVSKEDFRYEIYLRNAIRLCLSKEEKKGLIEELARFLNTKYKQKYDEETPLFTLHNPWGRGTSRIVVKAVILPFLNDLDFVCSEICNVIDSFLHDPNSTESQTNNKIIAFENARKSLQDFFLILRIARTYACQEQVDTYASLKSLNFSGLLEGLTKDLKSHPKLPPFNGQAYLAKWNLAMSIFDISNKSEKEIESILQSCRTTFITDHKHFELMFGVFAMLRHEYTEAIQHWSTAEKNSTKNDKDIVNLAMFFSHQLINLHDIDAGDTKLGLVSPFESLAIEHFFSLY